MSVASTEVTNESSVALVSSAANSVALRRQARSAPKSESKQFVDESLRLIWAEMLARKCDGGAASRPAATNICIKISNRTDWLGHSRYRATRAATGIRGHFSRQPHSGTSPSHCVRGDSTHVKPKSMPRHQHHAGPALSFWPHCLT